jgi:hypothetical protein
MLFRPVIFRMYTSVLKKQVNFPGLILDLFACAYQVPNPPHFNPEDEGNMFLRNVGIKPEGYTVQ